MSNLNEEICKVDFDELVNSATPAPDVFSVTLRGVTVATKLKRGTVLAISDTDVKMVVLGTTLKTTGSGETAKTETLTANCILSDDVDAGTADTSAFAYRTGHFNRNSLIVADGYTLKATDEEELRKGGILLSDAVKI